MHDQVRKSITTLIFVLSAGAFSAALGQVPKTPIALKPDAPDRYIVVPGDTLWGIAERYTDSPWRWGELWDMNKDQIRNPHLIYPGNVIVIDRTRVRLAIADTGTGTLKMSPKVRAESTAKQEIPSIPPSVIEPFLTRPLVVEPEGLDRAATIVGTEENRVVLGAGNRAYVRGMGDAKAVDWFVYRQGGPLVDPDTNTTLGFEAVYLGTARVLIPGDPATVELTTATREVSAGDKLVPAGKPQLVNYAPRAPGVQVKGRVISLYGGVSRTGEAGPQDVIALNRGKAGGLEVGHVLALYNQGATVIDHSQPKVGVDQPVITLPNERYGVAFVFRVFEQVSYALVMHVTRPVRPLDVVQNP
jgi:hypothetical protein